MLAKALQLKPEAADAYYYLAFINRSEFEYTESYRNINKALSIEPKNLEFKKFAASAALNVGDNNKVIALCSELIEEDSLEYGYYFKRGTAYTYLGDKDNQLKDLRKAYLLVNKEIDKNPGELNLVIDKANIAYDFLGIRHSILVLKNMVIDYPDHLEARAMLASHYLQNDQFSESAEEYTYIIESGKGGSFDYNNRGYDYLMLQEYDKTLSDFEKAIELAPGFAYTYNNIGFIYLKKGKLELAEEYINKSLELMPTNLYALKNQALLFYEKGDKELGCQMLKEANERGFKARYGNEIDQLLLELCQD